MQMIMDEIFRWICNSNLMNTFDKYTAIKCFLSRMTFNFVDTALRAAISDSNHCIFNKSKSDNVTFRHTSIKLTDCTNCTKFETQTKLNKLNFNKNANTIWRGDRTNKIKVQSLKINTIVSGSMSDFPYSCLTTLKSPTQQSRSSKCLMSYYRATLCLEVRFPGISIYSCQLKFAIVMTRHFGILR